MPVGTRARTRGQRAEAVALLKDADGRVDLSSFALSEDQTIDIEDVAGKPRANGKSAKVNLRKNKEDADVPSAPSKIRRARSTPVKRSKASPSRPDTESATDAAPTRTPRKRTISRSSSTPTRRSSSATMIKNFTPPSNWRHVYSLISDFRSRTEAVVDTMGCTSLHSPTAPPADVRWQTLMSLMLSSQTRDQRTAEAMANVHAAGLGTVDSIIACKEEELREAIKPVGFYRRKTEYIKKAATICKEEHHGDIPPDLEGLLKLPGVGPKMAYLCLQSAWGTNAGIGVDVHVHRISNRLGWVPNTSTPEKTRMALETWLPKDLWGHVNGMLVGFGQTCCLPVGPKCPGCPVGQECPSYMIARAKKRKQASNGRAKNDEKEKNEASDVSEPSGDGLSSS